MTNRVTSYIKVGQNKGQARLWLESQRLAANGFAPGETYRTVLDLDARTLTLELDLFGDRRVCKRSRKLKSGSVDVPILDLCSAELTEFLGDAERVRVQYTDGKLTISLHHEDVARIERETRLQRNLSQGVIKTGIRISWLIFSLACNHRLHFPNGKTGWRGLEQMRKDCGTREFIAHPSVYLERSLSANLSDVPLTADNTRMEFST